MLLQVIAMTTTANRMETYRHVSCHRETNTDLGMINRYQYMKCGPHSCLYNRLIVLYRVQLTAHRVYLHWRTAITACACETLCKIWKDLDDMCVNFIDDHTSFAKQSISVEPDFSLP
jgi:hypothetical protein